MASLQAHLLVASRSLLDPNFVRTVVFILQHTKQGALGVVLNRPVDKTIRQLWEELGTGGCPLEQPVRLGGPVPGPLIAVHTNQFFAEMEIMPGIFFAARKDHLDELVRHIQDPLRVFVGHSGWGPGQLENELAQGAWLTLPATVEYIFHDGADLWETVTRQIGRQTLQSALRLKHIPDDPSVN
jgi:putative transcriptional regulator